MPKKSRKNRAKRKNSQVARQGNIAQPPVVNLVVGLTHTFRFSTSSAQTGYNVEAQDLLGLMGVATSATGVMSLLAAVRIKRVRIWSVASSAAQVNPDVSWIGSSYPEPKRLNNSTMGASLPGCLESKPPRDGGADAGNWVYPSVPTREIFRIVVPAAATVDVLCDIRFQNGSALQLGVPLTYTSSGLTTGYAYFGYLDKSSGAAKLIPTDVLAYG